MFFLPSRTSITSIDLTSLSVIVIPLLKSIPSLLNSLPIIKVRLLPVPFKLSFLSSKLLQPFSHTVSPFFKSDSCAKVSPPSVISLYTIFAEITSAF
jgi:hypothetical protein